MQAKPVSCAYDSLVNAIDRSFAWIGCEEGEVEECYNILKSGEDMSERILSLSERLLTLLKKAQKNGSISASFENEKFTKTFYEFCLEIEEIVSAFLIYLRPHTNHFVRLVDLIEAARPSKAGEELDAPDFRLKCLLGVFNSEAKDSPLKAMLMFRCVRFSIRANIFDVAILPVVSRPNCFTWSKLWIGHPFSAVACFLISDAIEISSKTITSPSLQWRLAGLSNAAKDPALNQPFNISQTLQTTLSINSIPPPTVKPTAASKLASNVTKSSKASKAAGKRNKTSSEPSTANSSARGSVEDLLEDPVVLAMGGRMDDVDGHQTARALNALLSYPGYFAYDKVLALEHVQNAKDYPLVQPLYRLTQAINEASLTEIKTLLNDLEDFFSNENRSSTDSSLENRSSARGSLCTTAKPLSKEQLWRKAVQLAIAEEAAKIVAQRRPGVLQLASKTELSVLASRLGLGLDELEQATAAAIAFGLLKGKIDQETNTLTIHAGNYRKFGMEQWQEVENCLSAWRFALQPLVRRNTVAAS